MGIQLILFGGIMPLFIAGSLKPGLMRDVLHYLSGCNMGMGIIMLIENTIKMLNGGIN